jgi:hypothetical protein
MSINRTFKDENSVIAVYCHMFAYIISNIPTTTVDLLHASWKKAISEFTSKAIPTHQNLVNVPILRGRMLDT